MYEDQTFDVILQRMLSRVPETMDKRESSPIYAALAPAAVELTSMYIAFDCMLAETFGDTASREYLLNAPQSIHTSQKLHINSAAGYWSAFRAVLHTAYRDRKIKENPNGFLDRIECIPTMREHLSQEELIRLAETPCEEEVLKRAFLFGCLTGLRKSDIRQLTWQQIQPYTNGKMFVTTRMQKTKQIVHNPISDEAYGLLGERHEGLIFDGFKDKMLQGPLKRWLLAAGITKKITFHCTRHSFGSLHVEMGTDMAVIQAYLGHKNITTTQIYSKMAAQQMCEVVDKITLKRKEA